MTGFYLALGNGIPSFPTVAAVRAAYAGAAPPVMVFVLHRGTFTWKAFAGIEATDTGTESTSAIAIAGTANGALLQDSANAIEPRVAIGTGVAWVTLQTVALADMTAGGARDVSWVVRGRCNTAGTAWSHIRARGLVCLTATGAPVVISVAAAATTLSDPRIQAVLVGTDLLIQAQQHAVQSWIFESEYSWVNQRAF